jgi:hypothetical protein
VFPLSWWKTIRGIILWPDINQKCFQVFRLDLITWINYSNYTCMQSRFWTLPMSHCETRSIHRLSKGRWLWKSLE